MAPQLQGMISHTPCLERPQTCKSELVCRGLEAIPSLHWELWDRRTLSHGVASHDSRQVLRRARHCQYLVKYPF